MRPIAQGLTPSGRFCIDSQQSEAHACFSRASIGDPYDQRPTMQRPTQQTVSR